MAKHKKRRKRLSVVCSFGNEHLTSIISCDDYYSSNNKSVTLSSLYKSN